MFSKISVASVLASLLVAQASSAVLVTKSALDIFSPHIISPNAQTVWTVGQEEVVTWDTSNAPAHISNLALVVLDHNTANPLASGFDLLAGSVTVVVPSDVTPGHHQITLFGDSGNVSPVFTIIAA